MTTATRKTAAQQRTMQVYPNAKLLFIQEGKKTSGYMVDALDAPNAFQLMKNDGTVYNVCINGQQSLCDCIGFEHKGMHTKDGKGCRHVAALAKLQQLGKLPTNKTQRKSTVGEYGDFQDP